MNEKIVKETVFVYENLLQSICADIFTFAMIISMIGLGVYLGSNSMQWFGAFMAFITIYSRSGASPKRMSREEAIEFLIRLDEKKGSEK